MRRFVLACVLFASIVGCKKDDSTTTVVSDAPALAGDKYSLTWGPVDVPVGVENTQCIWLRLSNDAPIKVHQMHNALSVVSHHLIVYKDDMDTVEQTTPMPCQPFTGALNTTGAIEPIVITQKHDDEISLPDGVAYTLDAHQMIKLEMHYINATDSDQMGQATVDLFAADPATIHDEAGLMFAGSLDIDILPNQQFTLHQFLTLPAAFNLSSSHIWAMTGHEHKLGTGVTINVAPSRDGPMTSEYAPNPFLWAEPVTTTYDPDFSIPQSGGFDFTCTYTNTTNAEVKFGESANDEMCFFWVYYWPSQGSRVCAHTQQIGGVNGYDICCPGDSNCSLIGSHF
jgi:Copper type II ascorbate-dependent monooxygenase, C-terminal domain